MWNKSKSLILSIFCTRLFFVLLTAAVCFAPWIVEWYFGVGPWAQARHIPFRLTIYFGAVPAFILLACLHKLLLNIRVGKIFEKINSKMLRIISWCCIAVGLIMLCSSFYYVSFLILSVACAFFGLIVRVIKNIFEQAIEMKSDYDFTI